MQKEFTVGGKIVMYLFGILSLPFHLIIFLAGVSYWLWDKGDELILDSYKKNS